MLDSISLSIIVRKDMSCWQLLHSYTSCQFVLENGLAGKCKSRSGDVEFRSNCSIRVLCTLSFKKCSLLNVSHNTAAFFYLQEQIDLDLYTLCFTVIQYIRSQRELRCFTSYMTLRDSFHFVLR